MASRPPLRVDRVSTILFTAGEFTAERLRNIAIPQGSSRYYIVFLSTSTASGFARTSWISTAHSHPADYAQAEGWPPDRVISVIFDRK